MTGLSGTTVRERVGLLVYWYCLKDADIMISWILNISQVRRTVKVTHKDKADKASFVKGAATVTAILGAHQ